MGRPPHSALPPSRPQDEVVDGRVDPGSFLEKRSYRRRRRTDGLRLLPILGLWLFMVPLLWPGTAARLTDTGVPMSTALLYIFLVWCGLIGLCAWLSAGQGTGGAHGSDETATDADPGEGR